MPGCINVLNFINMNKTSGDKISPYVKLWDSVKNFLSLKAEDVKLLVCEKATVLLSTLIVCVVATILGACILFFLTFAAAQWIGESLGMAWAYLIIAGVYVILVALVLLLRRQLILDPVARFITKVILS